ncbi:Hypothetical protein NGAL_HAMBI2566_59730 [Neorhizobium galegae bv. orientalis]|nr:Hypothetical protein NGAL_HAMBI2566_59730 [Neorhizobium galegae bv. orientalis]
MGIIKIDPNYQPPVPASVTARQFKLQLVTAGLIDQVDAWIATQDRARPRSPTNTAARSFATSR